MFRLLLAMTVTIAVGLASRLYRHGISGYGRSFDANRPTQWLAASSGGASPHVRSRGCQSVSPNRARSASALILSSVPGSAVVGAPGN